MSRGRLPLFTLLPRRILLGNLHSYTRIPVTVLGRRQASLISELPRRVLLGNWGSGVWGSRKLGFRGFTILGSLVAGKGDSRNLKPRYLFALALGSTPD